MNLENRISRLEDYCPKQRRIEDMSDDELAESMGTKAIFVDVTL